MKIEIIRDGKSLIELETFQQDDKEKDKVARIFCDLLRGSRLSSNERIGIVSAAEADDIKKYLHIPISLIEDWEKKFKEADKSESK